MKKEKTKKFKILPALLLCFSLLACIPSNIAKAESSSESIAGSSELSFSMSNIDENKVIELEGVVELYNVTTDDVSNSDKIEVGDSLKDCIIIIEKTADFRINSINGNFIACKNNGGEGVFAVCYGSSQIPPYELFSETGDNHQLLYLKGDFGKIGNIVGNAYFYNDAVYTFKPIEVGDKVLEKELCVMKAGTNSIGMLFTISSTQGYFDFVYYPDFSGSKIQASNNGNPPCSIDSLIEYEEKNNIIVFKIKEGFDILGNKITEESEIFEISDYPTYFLCEMKNEKTDNETTEPESSKQESSKQESSGGVIGGDNSNESTIGNLNDKNNKKEETNNDWLWYSLAGILLSGGAIFVLKR